MKQAKSRAPAPWIRPRHTRITNFCKIFFLPYLRHKFHISIEPFAKQGDRQYLVMTNHQTGFDQFFLACCFKNAVYYVASEDLFSNGFVSRLLRYSVAPIPIKKSVADIRAVINCTKVAREGGTIAIAPEGNRTYSGRTGNIKASIAMLARKLGLPIAFFRIDGGYGVQPRWSDVVRKGTMRAYVKSVLEPEEYAAMSDEQLYDHICRELYTDESCDTGLFVHKKSAEYLERAMYYCPRCGLSRFESHGREIKCLDCGDRITYGDDKRLSGVGFDFPYEFIGDWYDAQERFIRHLDLTPFADTPLYTDTSRFSRVIIGKKKKLLARHATLSVYADRFEVSSRRGKKILPFDEVIAVSVLGRNKLNVYHGDDLYQFKSTSRFNALKYMNIYYHAVAVKKGISDEFQFLGL